MQLRVDVKSPELWAKVIIKTNRFEGYISDDVLYREPNGHGIYIFSKKDDHTWCFSAIEILRNLQWFNIILKKQGSSEAFVEGMETRFNELKK